MAIGISFGEDRIDEDIVNIPDMAKVDEQAKDAILELEKKLEKIKEDTTPVVVKKKAQKSKISPEDVDNMPEDDLMEGIDSEVRDLYEKFNAFMEQRGELKQDLGTKQVIPTGIDLIDTILGGGFAVGSISILVGNPGSGKSMLAMQTLGSAQRKFNGRAVVSFLDAEQSTTTQRLYNLGVKLPKIRPYSDFTLEKVFSFLELTCVQKEQEGKIDTPTVVVWDSIANTLSTKEQEIDDVNQTIGLKARILSRLLPKYVAKCAKYNICLIAVNQLRDLISIDRYHPASNDLKFMTSSKDMPAGNAIKYNAFHLVELKIRGLTDIDKHGFNGVIVGAKCVKNKLFPPNIEVNIVGDFVHGFSNFWTNYTFLTDNKIIQAASWNTLPGYSKKFRTRDANKLYNTDPEFQKSFDELSKTSLQEFARKHEDLNYTEDLPEENEE